MQSLFLFSFLFSLSFFVFFSPFLLSSLLNCIEIRRTPTPGRSNFNAIQQSLIFMPALSAANAFPNDEMASAPLTVAPLFFWQHATGARQKSSSLVVISLPPGNSQSNR